MIAGKVRLMVDVERAQADGNASRDEIAEALAEQLIGFEFEAGDDDTVFTVAGADPE